MGLENNVPTVTYKVVSPDEFYGLPEGPFSRIPEEDYSKPVEYKVVNEMESYSESERVQVPEDNLPVARVGMSQLEDLTLLMYNNNNVEVLSPGLGDSEDLRKEKFPLLLSIIKGVQLQNLEDFLIISYRSSLLEVSPVRLLESMYPSHDDEFIDAYRKLIEEGEKTLGSCNVDNWQDFSKLLHLLWKKDHDYTAKISKRSKGPACDGWLYDCEFVRNVWLNSICNSDIDDRIISFERSIGTGEYEETGELDIENTFIFHELLMEFNIIWISGNEFWKNQFFIQPDRITVNIEDSSIKVIDNKIGKQFKPLNKFGVADNAQQSLLYLASSMILANLANESFFSQFSMVKDLSESNLSKVDSLRWIQNKWMQSTFVLRGKRRFPRFELMITPDECQHFANSTKNYFRDNSGEVNSILDVTPDIRKGIKDLRKLSKYAIMNKQVFRDYVNAKKKNPWFVMPQFPSTNKTYQRFLPI